MARIEVVERAVGTYDVTVSGGGRTTRHTVSVPAGLADRLGCGQMTDVELVERSFEFLLARESATSILSSFRLDQIGEYFPEYPTVIGRSPAPGGPGQAAP
ncbi:MAG: hypothetical protein ACRDY1_09765 [Acidimicrobiales bacterium]